MTDDTKKMLTNCFTSPKADGDNGSLCASWCVRLIEKFQCPGCVSGSDTQCGEFVFDSNTSSCSAHVLGTSDLSTGPFALGLPKGFCRPGFDADRKPRDKIDIRLWEAGTTPGWDRLNIAVWAMEYEGALMVRTFMPRINFTAVDVIDGGALSIAPGAINVADFIEDID
jgi:hypothetical protein